MGGDSVRRESHKLSGRNGISGIRDVSRSCGIHGGSRGHGRRGDVERESLGLRNRSGFVA